LNKASFVTYYNHNKMNHYIILSVILSLALCAHGSDSLISNADNVLLSTSSLISAHNNTQLIVLEDGNVILSHVKSGIVIWSTNTQAKGVAPYQLVLQNNGNLELLDSTAQVLWASKTANSGCAPYKLSVTNAADIEDCKGNVVWSAVHRGLVSYMNKRTGNNPCYEVGTACADVVGMTSTQLVAVANIIQNYNDIGTIWSQVSGQLGKTSVYFVVGGYEWYSWFTYGCTCTCNGVAGTFLIVHQ